MPTPKLNLCRIFLVLILAFAAEPFAIEIVDDQTGRGVPLVELTTTSGTT
jgi:hypothetical protein